MVPFIASLRIYPVSMHGTRPKTDKECGGKVLLPVSALHALTSRLSFQQGPMLFTISLGTKHTNCGVLEFIADEGIVNAPSWIFDSISAKVGDVVQVSLFRSREKHQWFSWHTCCFYVSTNLVVEKKFTPPPPSLSLLIYVNWNASNQSLRK